MIVFILILILVAILCPDLVYMLIAFLVGIAFWGGVLFLGGTVLLAVFS